MEYTTDIHGKSKKQIYQNPYMENRDISNINRILQKKKI